MSLNDDSTGMWLIRTESGSQYRLDMDERTITRNNAESPRSKDGTAQKFDGLVWCRTGGKLMWLDEDGGMHTGTGVESIERI